MKDLHILKRLIKAYGVSGNEDEVRELIKREIRRYVDVISIDNMGNLIAHKRGKAPRIMLAAHLDEVGLMIKKIDNSGLIYCTEIGGLDVVPLLGNIVHISTKNGIIHGVITTPLISAGKDMEKIPTIEEIVIDTGLKKKELVKMGVRKGTYLPFENESDSIHLGSKETIFGKALDDRIGCFVLIELAKRIKKSKSDLFFVFTVQEEVGLYGAKTSTFKIQPDWGIAVDTTHANDLFTNPTRFLGKGPCITVKDGELIADKRINNALIEVAEEMKIPYQIEVTEEGTTDATNMMITRGGVPSGVISVPIRNIHTTFSIANVRDIENTILLLEGFLKRFPKNLKKY